MRATFPAGTVSGAPKLERCKLFLSLNNYAGMHMRVLWDIGYEGNHDSCIAIRTAMILNGKMHLQAGAGMWLIQFPKMNFLKP